MLGSFTYTLVSVLCPALVTFKVKVARLPVATLCEVGVMVSLMPGASAMTDTVAESWAEMEEFSGSVA